MCAKFTMSGKWQNNGKLTENESPLFLLLSSPVLFNIQSCQLLPNIHKRHFNKTLPGCYSMSSERCHCGVHCVRSSCVVSRPVTRRPSSRAQCCTEVIEDDSRLKTAAIWHRWIIVICFPRDSIEASRAFLITNSFLNTNHPPRTVLTILLSSWKFKL